MTAVLKYFTINNGSKADFKLCSVKTFYGVYTVYLIESIRVADLRAQSSISKRDPLKMSMGCKKLQKTCDMHTLFF